MPGDASFGTAVLTLSADRSKLKSDLAAAQKDVVSSSAKMQNSLSATGDSSAALSASLATVSAAAALTGNRTLALSAAAITLGNSLSGLGAIADVVIVKLTALKTVMWTTIVPVSAMIGAVTVALGLLGAIVWRQGIADFLEGVNESNEALKKQHEILRKQQKTIQEQIKAEKEKRRILLGGEKRLSGNTALAEQQKLTRELEKKVKLDKEAASISAAANISQGDRIASLRFEVDVLEGRKKVTDSITNALELQLTLKKNQIVADKELAKKERERSKAALEADKQRRRELGLASNMSVVSDFRSEIARSLASKLIDARRRKLIELLPSGMQKPAREMMGLDTQKDAAGKGGLASVSSFGGLNAARNAANAVFAGNRDPIKLQERTVEELEKMVSLLEQEAAREKGLASQ